MNLLWKDIDISKMFKNKLLDLNKRIYHKNLPQN